MAFSETFDAGGVINTDAGFRAWGLAIRTALLAAGLTRTADTGQIDFSSVSAPSAGSYGGYDIFQFTDSLQGSDPIYFKLEYGRGSTSDRHQLRVTCGTGSDGSGGITNAASARGQVTGTGAPTDNCYIAASFFDGILCLFVSQNPFTSDERVNLTFVIERLYAPDGSNGIGWGMTYHAGGSVGFDVRAGGSWSAGSSGNGFHQCGSMIDGRAVLGGYRYSNAPAQCLGQLVLPDKLPRNMPVTVDFNGEPWEYKTLPVVSDINSVFTASPGDACGLIRVA